MVCCIIFFFFDQPVITGACGAFSFITVFQAAKFMLQDPTVLPESIHRAS